MASELQKFTFEGLPVRGCIVQLRGAWHELVLRRASSAQPYAESVCSLLGQMSAAALLMHASIKFDGTLLIQIMGGLKGEGGHDAKGDVDTSPVRFAAAEARTGGAFRATAKVGGEVQEPSRLSQLINASGKARCAITLDARETQPHAQPYLGMVSLVDDRGCPFEQFSDLMAHYMCQSEQIDTKLVLAANNEVAAGVLIQRLPQVKGRTITDTLGQNEDFRRIALLTSSLKSEELLSCSIEDILHRLYWQEPIARWRPAAHEDQAGARPHFSCTCSRERVARTIRNLGQTAAQREVEAVHGIDVHCDFCGASYRFDVAQTAEIFQATKTSDAS